MASMAILYEEQYAGESLVLVKPTKQVRVRSSLIKIIGPTLSHNSYFCFVGKIEIGKTYPLVICNIAIEAMANILVVSTPINTMVILHTHLGLPEGRHLPYKTPMAQSK